MSPAAKLNSMRKASLYKALYGEAYGSHLLWILSVELGAKIPPVIQSSIPIASRSWKNERCAVCVYFSAYAHGYNGLCIDSDSEVNEDDYCFTFERRK